ncbi:protein serine/threonine kinase, putative [Entamoeba dispar SAW760]|uniref:Protein serine/threonine kinase, putative n=1 Tax=Entamoeba dispar (strain ATCC PRA-260 / SAW760) TaxID=370354 RepID=B0EB28_ENTDS|nr:protein serine/threonine kinase, putative [Entamoeba dispar SAW760]EDR28267.1 protein serine/threonine kinase, putative [Entamoeba dispar SAW760]|eukprot:EDR28267.1 protein serine/threonine kinase, putative [Entamoeba dispar SAW760]
MMKAGTGCAICKDGFYRKDVDCQECIKNCTKCLDGNSCISCEDNFFLYNGRQCISYDMLTSCKTKTPNGCTLCEDGYVLKTPYCQSCLEVTEHCTSCSTISCYSCEENYVLIGDKCVHYRAIEHCSKSTDSKCSKCDFWYSVSTSGTYCQKQPVVWFIVLICILGSIIVILIIAGVVVLSWYFIKKTNQNKRPDNVHYFFMKDSDIIFEPLTGRSYVVTDKKELHFDKNKDELMIPVGEESTDTINVGNGGKSKLKVQFTVKEDDMAKFQVRIEPEMAILTKGEGCEFKISIKPVCTCKISESIQLVSLDFKQGVIVNEDVLLITETQMSTRLDYDELIMEKQIGEGSFGTVYKGMFRGNSVAIKVMKIPDDDEQMEEFEKEVRMLDKFRSEYIVHFYGAVFIPTKICMVTEFAKFGSLMGMINKKKK